MNGGEAADQVVRLTMEGAEFALKIAGEGAERILALLMAALQPSPGKAQKQTTTKLRGRERLKTMLKSGAELKFFEIQGKDLKAFAAAAKKYGLAYCVLRKKGDTQGMVEIMARAEDAPKISRILEKMEAYALDGSVRGEAAQQEKAEKPKRAKRKKRTARERESPVQEPVTDFFSPPEKKGQAMPENPTPPRATAPVSATFSQTRHNEHANSTKSKKPSVLEDLKAYAVKKKTAAPKKEPPAKSKSPRKATPKKKSKERT